MTWYSHYGFGALDKKIHQVIANFVIVGMVNNIRALTRARQINYNGFSNHCTRAITH
jgi:hypothetical protein